MSVDIERLGSTIISGGVFLYFLLYLLGYLIKPAWYPLPPGGGEIKDFGLRAMLIGLCFAVGILLEDFSQRFVRHGILLWPQSEDLQIEPLFDRSDCGNGFLAKRLAHELSRREIFSQFSLGDGEGIEKLLREQGASVNELRQVIDDKAVRAAVPSLYFHALNVVMLHTNYNEDLKRYQLRLEFCRSLSFAFLLLTVVSLLVLPIEYWNRCSSRRKRHDGTYFFKNKHPLSLWLVLMVSIIVLLATSKAYSSGQIQYNYRVYGYFSTLMKLRDDRDPPFDRKPTAVHPETVDRIQ